LEEKGLAGELEEYLAPRVRLLVLTVKLSLDLLRIIIIVRTPLLEWYAY